MKKETQLTWALPKLKTAWVNLDGIIFKYGKPIQKTGHMFFRA